MRIENPSEWKPAVNALYQNIVFGYGGDAIIADEHARELVRLTLENPSMRGMIEEHLMFSMFSMVVMEAEAKADKAEAKAEAKAVRKRSKKHG